MKIFIWLLINATVYLVLGFLFLFRFESIIGNLDIVPQTGSAAIELMAVYGGLEIGFGILFLTALFKKEIRLFALQILAFSYLCFAVGRFVGMMTFTVTSTMTYYLFSFEAIGFAISLMLLRSITNLAKENKWVLK